MKWKPFLISFGIIAFLLTTFLSPWTEPLWTWLDLAIFKTLNGTLEGNKFLQYFWALINHKKMDLVEDAVFLLFFIWGVVSTPKDQRWKKTAQFIFCILLAGSVIFFVNRNFLRYNVLIPRDSPSLTVPCFRITEHIPWKDLKDETIASFPATMQRHFCYLGFSFPHLSQDGLRSLPGSMSASAFSPALS